MHATAQRQAAALTLLTVVVCAAVAFLTAVAAPAQADPTTTVRMPPTQPTAPPTSAPEPDGPAVPVVHDIAVTTMLTTSNVDTYTGPGTGYDRAGSIVAGTEVQVDGVTDDSWYRLVDGRFVNGAFLAPAPEPEPEAQDDAGQDNTAQTDAGQDDATAVSMWTTVTVNARTGPGTQYDKAGSLPAGTEVRVDGRTDDGWYRLTDGRFVLGTYLSAWVPVPVPPEHDAQRQQAEAEGARLGVVVRWTTLPGSTVGQWKASAPGTVGIDVAALTDQIAVLAVRHEAAHQAIYNVCGTPTPLVAGDRPENVTDAYADLFNGGMNGFVGPVHDGVQAQVGYGQPTLDDYDAARAVHAGRCS